MCLVVSSKGLIQRRVLTGLVGKVLALEEKGHSAKGRGENRAKVAVEEVE